MVLPSLVPACRLRTSRHRHLPAPRRPSDLLAGLLTDAAPAAIAAVTDVWFAAGAPGDLGRDWQARAATVPAGCAWLNADGLDVVAGDPRWGRHPVAAARAGSLLVLARALPQRTADAILDGLARGVRPAAHQVLRDVLEFRDDVDVVVPDSLPAGHRSRWAAGPPRPGSVPVPVPAGVSQLTTFAGAELPRYAVQVPTLDPHTTWQLVRRHHPAVPAATRRLQMTVLARQPEPIRTAALLAGAPAVGGAVTAHRLLHAGGGDHVTDVLDHDVWPSAADRMRAATHVAGIDVDRGCCPVALHHVLRWPIGALIDTAGCGALAVLRDDGVDVAAVRTGRARQVLDHMPADLPFGDAVGALAAVL